MTKGAAQSTLADIRIHKYHLLSCHRENGSHVTRDEALALSRCGRCGHHYLCSVTHVAQAKAQDAEGFHHRRIALDVGNERAVVVFGILETRNFAQNRNGSDILNILAVTHIYIELKAEPKEEGGDEQTNDKAHKHNNHAARTHLLVANRTFNQTYVSLVDSLLQCHFLAFVEQVSVESLFK